MAAIILNSKRNNIVAGIADKLGDIAEYFEEYEVCEDLLDETLDLWKEAHRFTSCRKYNLFSNENVRKAQAIINEYLDAIATDGESDRRVSELAAAIAAYLAA